MALVSPFSHRQQHHQSNKKPTPATTLTIRERYKKTKNRLLDIQVSIFLVAQILLKTTTPFHPVNSLKQSKYY